MAASDPLDLTPERLAEMRAGQAAAIARRHRRAAPPLTRVLPAPVVIRLGGRLVAVGELRLIDLAELQQWLTDQVPHPLDALPPAGLDPDPESRRSRVLAAWEAAKDYPPRFGSASARPLLASAAGLVRVLGLCLRRGDPAATEADALDLATAMDALDWARLHRVAYGGESWQELLRELDPPADDPAPPPNWVEAILDVVEHRHWTFEQVGHLTLSQWRALRGGANAFAYRCEPRPGETLAEARERERRMLLPNPEEPPDHGR